MNGPFRPRISGSVTPASPLQAHGKGAKNPKLDSWTADIPIGRFLGDGPAIDPGRGEWRKQVMMRAVQVAGVAVLALGLSACAIKNGPEFLPEAPPVAGQEPVLRIGEISETLTGSWVQDPGIGTSAIRSHMIDALQAPDVASRFSSSSSNLTLNIDITSDHASDQPRLSQLGAISILTLGVVPLNYHSHWDIDCHVEVIGPDGNRVADYTFQERGTYRIWAMPLTMFTLLGAGIRAEHDGHDIFERVATNLARKIAEAVDNDYPKLAARAGRSRTETAAPGVPIETLRPLIP
jgi:hypothetical protein